jgi:hypothetical protein
MTDRANWKLDDDELLSAIKIIERASTEDIGTHEGHPTFRAESVELPQIEGFRAVAFALPGILQKWAGQIREVALDSACEKPSLPEHSGLPKLTQGRRTRVNSSYSPSSGSSPGPAARWLIC